MMIANHVRRPVPAFAREGATAQRGADLRRLARLRERLRLRPVLAAVRRSEGRGHRALRQHGLTNWRESVWSFTYNHIGHFANASHAFAKALILGGVTQRFPQLRFAHARGRRGLGLQPAHATSSATGSGGGRARDGEPDAADQPRPGRAGAAVPRVRRRAPTRTRWTSSSAASNLAEPFTSGRARRPSAPTGRARSSTTSARSPSQSGDELRRHFAERFYFGCEADDPMTAWAFDTARPPPAASRSSARTSATSTCSTCRRCSRRPGSWWSTG